MSNCLHHKTGGLIISKLFREIENLYELDKDAFKLLLKEAVKMFDELMSNSFAWIFLSLCTIFSVIFAIYTWIVGYKRKEISVDYSSNDIIKQGKQPIPKLDIKYEHKTIQDLSATIFYICHPCFYST